MPYCLPNIHDTRFAYNYYFFAALYGAAGLLFGFWNGTYWTVIPDIFGEELFPLAASCGESGNQENNGTTSFEGQVKEADPVEILD